MLAARKPLHPGNLWAKFKILLTLSKDFGFESIFQLIVYKFDFSQNNPSFTTYFIILETAQGQHHQH